MRLGRFTFYTTADSALRTTLLTAAGYALGANFHRVGDYLDPASWAALSLLVVFHVARVIRHKGRRVPRPPAFARRRGRDVLTLAGLPHTLMSKRKTTAALPFLSILLVLNALLFVRGQQATQPSLGAAPPAPDTEAAAAERRRETFEVVWQTVRESHFDPTFGGLDWEAVRREFAPLVARTRTDAELHALLQRMLNRLGQSHFNIVSPEVIPEFVDEAASEEEGGGEEGEEATGKEKDPLHPHKLKLTEHLTHGVGLDLRVLGNQAVITRVEPGSSAARAGLHPGYVIRSIDGRAMRSILRTLRLAALLDPSARHQTSARIVVGFLNGPAGSRARVSYLDGANRLRRAALARERLRGEMSPPLQNLPPQFVEFEARRLRGGIGYIRFNAFAAPVMGKFCEALRTMADAPGLVLDLRGNHGGILALLYGMGGLLSGSPLNLGEMRTREGGWLFNTVPQRGAYGGQLVVLVDGETHSAAEMLAAGLAETGRALTVGERTAGATLPSAVKELPTGALLQYAFADYLTPYGNAVEGKGVEPTLRVRLDRRALLAGRDPQLEAAIDAVAPAVAGPPARGKTDGGPIAVVAEDEGEHAAPGEEEPKAEGAPFPPAPVDARVAEVIAKYEAAVGGREAFAKLATRVSEGTVEGVFGGVTVGGTFETFEKEPGRLLNVIRMSEVGSLRRAHTGTYAYEQATLYGFRALRGRELADMTIEADLRWPVRLREHYARLTYKGTHEAAGATAHVIEAVPTRGTPTTLFFDQQSGLLVRRDGLDLEDYREVDGVRLPFLLRSPQMTLRLQRVRHNVTIADELFAEEKDCFTR
jgi:carboxyl-terminal processing protease